MGMNVTQKIISKHLSEGKMLAGTKIGIRIDQTLTQDSTGTMAYLQLEAMGIDRVKTLRSVAYIDHNMLQQGFENADDHKYIQTVANKYGIYFSRAGNGICHQVHLERFAVPGQTLLGSDSHTPTCGGMGMLAIGAGGLDVAVAMGGGTYYLNMPKVVEVELRGKLAPFVSAKDIILEVLRRISVKGGVGRVMEYTGDGVASLSVPERATIANMGAELGATTSVFPSDEITESFMKAQGRGEDFVQILADKDAVYDEKLVIELDKLEPMIALPHSPDNVKKVSEVEGTSVDQIVIGSCTNSSYTDMMKVAAILKGRVVPPNTSLVIAPGSRQVLSMLAQNGALYDMISAGARILETGCGPCIGMGQAPATNGISLRTTNRNFKGRCGTASADVYLVSPETAAVSAVMGKLTDPRVLDGQVDISVKMPSSYAVNDNMIVAPTDDPQNATVIKGPNIKPFPKNSPLGNTVEGKVLICVEDNITTDHIMPSGASLLPFRSNIPYLSDFCLTPCDEHFPQRAKQNGGGFIVAGENYGQGSSREHAALVPLYLGIKGVIAKSFARIHKSNLINSGILPLVFENSEDYDKIRVGDEIKIENAPMQVENGVVALTVNGIVINTRIELTDMESSVILSGGKINSIKNRG